MLLSESFVIRNATPLDLTIEGETIDSTSPFFDEWAGRVTSSEPIVALVAAFTASSITWAKSSKHTAATLPIHLLTAKPEVDEKSGNVDFAILQVGTTDGYIQVRLPPLAMHHTSRVESAKLVTGRFHLLAQFAPPAPHSLMIMCLARQDVRGARQGVWHIKRQLADMTDPEWARLLNSGRSGHIVEVAVKA